MANISKTTTESKEVKLPTKVSSFVDVEKGFRTLEKYINLLTGAVNADGEREVTDKEGKTGDIRITRNPDKTHKLEVKTEDGWKFGTMGEVPVKYTDKPATISKPQATERLSLPKPDYESDWLELPNSPSAWATFNHNLGVLPVLVKIWLTNDDGVTRSCNWDTTASYGYSVHASTTQIKVHGSTYWGWAHKANVGTDDLKAVGHYTAGGTDEWKLKCIAWK